MRPVSANVMIRKDVDNNGVAKKMAALCGRGKDGEKQGRAAWCEKDGDNLKKQPNAKRRFFVASGSAFPLN